MRLIDADEFIEYCRKGLKDMSAVPYCKDSIKAMIEVTKGFIDDIEEQPTIDTAPVVHAHWKLDPNGMDWGIPAWTCSHCGGRNDMIPSFIFTKHGGYVPKNPNVFYGSDYCPCCGAKMDEVKHESRR